MITRNYAALCLNNDDGSPDHQTHYRTAGSGPPLILLHPSPMSSAFMLPIIDLLKDLTTVYALDTPGYGNSDPLQAQPRDLSPYVDWLAAFIRSTNLPSVGIYGSATGAQLAIQFARAYPDMTDYVVLDNAVHFTDAERNEILGKYFPDMNPVADASHLLKAWEMSSRLFTHFPWYEQGEENRVSDAQVPAEFINATALAYLNAGVNYDYAYRVAFMNEDARNMQAVEKPTRVIRWAGGMLKKYADRLDGYEWPDHIKMVHCDVGPEARYTAIKNAVGELAGL